jgi:hypothetical protein
MRPAGIRLVKLDTVRLVEAGEERYAGFWEGVWGLQRRSSRGSAERPARFRLQVAAERRST